MYYINHYGILPKYQALSFIFRKYFVRSGALLTTMFNDMLHGTVNKAILSMKGLMASTLPSVMFSGPTGPESSRFLTITDSRINRRYEIPIQCNAVEAVRFKEIEAPQDYHHAADKPEGGLRLLNPGFQNTAVMASQITFVDGIEESIRFRDISITSLVGQKRFEDVTFLLIWGHLPSQQEKENYRIELAGAMVPPQMVADVIRSFE